jgi:hypothetical protein
MRNEFDRAVKAYQRKCERDRCVFQQPCEASSEVTESHVILRNAAGDLAAFISGPATSPEFQLMPRRPRSSRTAPICSPISEANRASRR